MKSNRFNASELKKIRVLIEEYLEFFKQKWNDYFIN